MTEAPTLTHGGEVQESLTRNTHTYESPRTRTQVQTVQLVTCEDAAWTEAEAQALFQDMQNMNDYNSNFPEKCSSMEEIPDLGSPYHSQKMSEEVEFKVLPSRMHRLIAESQGNLPSHSKVVTAKLHQVRTASIIPPID